MRKLFFFLVGLWLLGSPLAMLGESWRVDLFSGRAIRTLKLRAGGKSANLCAAGQRSPCMTLQPGETAQCGLASTALRCDSADGSRGFRRLAVFSASPFQVEPILAASAGGTTPRPMALSEMEVTEAGKGLRVVATITFDDYVAGVLAGEASNLASGAARRAMAILARTWALRWRGRHRAEGFDFCALTHCQVFRPGAPTEVAAARKLDEAVRQTADRVLKFHGQLVDPYFSACCGGMTEAAGDLWPDRAEPYLVSVRDPYCAASEHASWQRVLSLRQVGMILRTDLHLPLTGPVIDLVIGKKDSSGRAQTLRAVGGFEGQIDANQFRFAVDRRLGWATLKSNLYTLERRGATVLLTGRGLGHGVGLCQAGAEEMARLGFSTEEILATYFPGAMISPLASPDTDPIASSEHFELVFPESQQAWVQQALQALESFRRSLGSRSAALPGRIRVQTWDTTEEFIRAAGQPGWAAASNDGQAIALQPLSLLARKGILHQTLRHELMHIVVQRLRAREVPLWYLEGLVLYCTQERIPAAKRGHDTKRSLDDAVFKPRSEAEMQAAYAEALERVQALARRRGEPALWKTLQQPTPEDLRWLKGSM